MTSQHHHNQQTLPTTTYQVIYRNSLGQARWENVEATSRADAFLVFENGHKSDYYTILDIYEADPTQNFLEFI